MKTANQRYSHSEAACKDSKLPPPVTPIHNSSSPYTIYIVGEEDKSQVPHPKEKVLLLVGVTGVGKGTLVNAMLIFMPLQPAKMKMKQR